MQTDQLILGTLFALFCASTSAALYKWVDDKGRIQYSDKPPADSAKGGVEMSNRGVVKKKLESGLTADEKKAKEDEAARRRAEREEALAQQRSDNALLQSFTNADEIDRKRDRELVAIEAMIANLKGQERSLLERWSDDKRRAEGHSKRGNPLPDGLKEDLARGENEVKVVREEIQRRHQEVTETKEKYAALRKRYVRLRQPTADAVPAMAPSPAPKPSAAKASGK